VLGGDRIVLTVERHHRWAGQSIPLRELFQEKYVIREAGSGTEKTVREALTRAGVDTDRMKIQASLGSNEAVKQAVAAGIGAAFLSEMSILKEVKRGEVVTVKVRGLTISRHFYLISRAGRQLSPPARALSGLLLERFGESGREKRKEKDGLRPPQGR
jgi:LysR family transcriptional regulator, low CO2-responsive transcriptional regulator